MNNENTTSKIKAFLAQQFPRTKNIGNDDHLLKSGFIDSLGILEIVSFVEKEFGIVIADEELLPENFGSIHSLANFVQAKTES